MSAVDVGSMDTSCSAIGACSWCETVVGVGDRGADTSFFGLGVELDERLDVCFGSGVFCGRVGGGGIFLVRGLVLVPTTARGLTSLSIVVVVDDDVRALARPVIDNAVQSCTSDCPAPFTERAKPSNDEQGNKPSECFVDPCTAL